MPEPSSLGRCKRCSRRDVPEAELVDLRASCGCVDRYCKRCRETKRGPSQYDHTVTLSMCEWLVSLGRHHMDQGGRYYRRFPCPTRYDDPKVVQFLEDYRSGKPQASSPRPSS